MSSKREVGSQQSGRHSVTSDRKSMHCGRSSISVLRSRGSFARHDSISAKAYHTVTPAASLLLQKKWDEMKYIEHRQKIENMKPVVDSNPPTVYRHFYANSCKMRDEEARKAEIMRDNIILLQRVSNVLASKSHLDNHNDYIPKSLNLGQRQRDMLKIAHENIALFQRIQMKEPHYNHMKWIDSWRVRQGYKAICSRHASVMDLQESRSANLAQKPRKVVLPRSSRIQLKVTP